MQSINTGKQNTFSWYSKEIPVTSIQIEKSSDLLSQIPISILDNSKVVPISFGSPKPSSPSFWRDAVAKSVSPLTDRIQLSRSPKEPSRIYKAPIQSKIAPTSEKASKHPFTSYSPSSPAELPFKRAKTSGTEGSSGLLDVALDLNNDFRDFNTVSGSDLVDFWFSHQVSSEIIALEEAERKERMIRRVDPVMSGRLWRVQKEFMQKLNPSIFASLGQSFSDIKDSLFQQKSEFYKQPRHLVDEQKQSIVGDIIRIADYRETIEQDGELVEFVWPRITSEIKAAEETARLERTSNRVDPVLFGKWKAVNSEVKSKFTSPVRSGLEQFDGAFVGKAADAIEDAIHFTTDLLGKLGFIGKQSFDAKWARMQEEKERARRINQTFVDPMLEAKKARIEREFLEAVNARGLLRTAL